MLLLLDTHALLWNITADARLSTPARTAIADGTNRVFVSLASLWETGTKLAQGRLLLPGNGLQYVIDYMREWRIELLPVTLDHVRAASQLPFHHGDPFDRMLVAQAQREGLRLVTSDSRVRQYDVDLFW